MKHLHKTLLVALAGQPNCGKTTVFNMLTGARQYVANFPGATVEKKQGRFKLDNRTVEVVDLPGTYSLTSYSQEERVTRDFLLLERPEVVVVVVDATNLARHLYLAFQLREMQIPMVLCLNMIDVADRQKLRIDVEHLSRALDTPVVATAASRGRGRDELREAILQTAETANHNPDVWRLDYGPELEPSLRRLEEHLAGREHLMEDFSARWLAVKLMESDFEAERILLHHAHDRQERALAAFADEVRDAFVAEAQRSPERIIAARRYEYAETLAGACVLRLGGGAKSWSDRVDELACHPVAGVALVIAVLFAVFHLTFQLADGWTWIPWADGWTTPVGVFQWIFDDWLPSITHEMSPGPFRSLLEDGVIGGVGGVISFVPLIFFMFVFLGILEDTGYVARMATVLDRVLRPFGLQGQSVLPLVLSGGIAGGCAVPGVMATRTLRDTRDRLVTMLVAPFMCCGAKIPVMALLVGAFFSAHEGLVLTGLVLLSWVVALGTARLLRLTAIRARQTPFVMELPAYHLPVAGTVLRSAGQRSWLYLQKAGTIILAVNILLWAAMSFPRPDARTYEIERRAARTELADNLSDNPYHPYLTAEELPATLALLERERSGEPLANPDATTPAAFRERLTLVRAAVGRLSPPPPDSDAPEAAEPSATDSSAPVDPDAAEPPALAEAADALARCVRTFASVNERYRADRLRGSLAGRLGRALAPASRLAGFDWRTNVALVGGVSAKELILSGLSTAYSMGRDAAPPPADQAGGSLGRRLRDVEDWTPIRALALMVFVLFYSPCLPALVVIGRESGTWRWAAFAAVFSTIIAFALAVALYQGGQFFAG